MYFGLSSNLLPEFWPKRLRAYRVPERPKPKVTEEIQHLLDLGVIRQSNSEMASPLVVVLHPCYNPNPNPDLDTDPNSICRKRHRIVDIEIEVTGENGRVRFLITAYLFNSIHSLGASVNVIPDGLTPITELYCLL